MLSLYQETWFPVLIKETMFCIESLFKIAVISKSTVLFLSLGHGRPSLFHAVAAFMAAH